MTMPPSSSTGEPPFACPKGYAWDPDRRRFYRLDAKLAKVDSTEPAQASSSSSSTRALAPVPQPDVPPSSYYFTPPQPPGAFTSASSPYLIPRDRPASYAASGRWREAQRRRHIRSLRCYSRDNISRIRRDGVALPAGSRNMLGVSSFDRTGSLLMVPFVEEKSDRTGPQVSHCQTLCFEQGTRSKGVERWLVDSALPTNDYLCIVADRDRDYSLAARPTSRRPVSSKHFTAHCKLEGEELVRTQRGGTRIVRQRAAVGTGFHKHSMYPRGLAIYRHEVCGLESVVDNAPAQHRVVNWQSAVVTQHPRLREIFPDDTDALISFIHHLPLEGEDTPKLVAVQLFSASRAYSALSAPRFSCFKRIKRPGINFRFHVMALNADSGLCWAGQRDGSIHVLDSMEFCYQQVIQKQQSGSFKPVNLHDIKAAAVTNLLPVGRAEVVACFSSGVIALLRAEPYEGTHVVRTFTGHVNEFGDMNVSACVDTNSRLLAVRGSDGLIRVWHLEHSLPLNSPLHESRGGQLDSFLIPEPQTSKAARLRTESRPGHSAADVSDQKRFEAYDNLFYLDFAHPDCKKARDIPLRDLVTRQSVKLHWGYPNWVGTRDAQWEISREVNGTDGLPRVERKGILPSLMLLENSSDGTRILWYEVTQQGII